MLSLGHDACHHRPLVWWWAVPRVSDRQRAIHMLRLRGDETEADKLALRTLIVLWSAGLRAECLRKRWEASPPLESLGSCAGSPPGVCRTGVTVHAPYPLAFMSVWVRSQSTFVCILMPVWPQPNLFLHTLNYSVQTVFSIA